MPNEDYMSAFKADKLNMRVAKGPEVHFKIFLQVIYDFRCIQKPQMQRKKIPQTIGGLILENLVDQFYNKDLLILLVKRNPGRFQKLIDAFSPLERHATLKTHPGSHPATERL